MWKTNSLRVAVVGAGIGGLSAASALQRAGAEVIVLEQSARFRPRGSGLSLFANGFAALDALGLGDAVRGVTTAEPPSVPIGTLDLRGRMLVAFSPETTAGLRVIDRAELHSALLHTLAPDTVRPGIRVESLSRGVLDMGPSGLLTEAHVIVGADGIRSRVRASHAGDPGAAYCGYGAWRGITDDPVTVHDGGETFGRGERFGYVPLRDGRVYWFAVRPSVANDHPGPGELTARYGRWHSPIPALIAATDPARIGYQPIERLAHPLRTYSRANATLLGDAAHAMPPTLGQGANLALEDSAVLVSLLTPLIDDPERSDVAAALIRYDRLRRRRTQRIARQAQFLGSAGQWAHPLITRSRDAALRLAPDTSVDTILRRIVRWTPKQ